ncbi:MAG: hypothetical protein ACI4WY_07310 [Anaerovoracaceae bacterium]
MPSNRQLIENPEKKDGWIPVAEQMPENERPVEITYTMEHYRTGETLYYTARAFYTDGKHSVEDSDYSWSDMDLEEYIEEEDAYRVPEGWWEDVSFSEEFFPVDAPVIAWKPLPEPWRGEESSTGEDCATCQHSEKSNNQYPCCHCRNCYLSKFKAKLGGGENE